MFLLSCFIITLTLPFTFSQNKMSSNGRYDGMSTEELREEGRLLFNRYAEHRNLGLHFSTMEEFYAFVRMVPPYPNDDEKQALRMFKEFLASYTAGINSASKDGDEAPVSENGKGISSTGN